MSGSNARGWWSLLGLVLLFGFPVYVYRSFTNHVNEGEARRKAEAAALAAEQAQAPKLTEAEQAHALALDTFKEIDTLDAAIDFARPSMMHAVGSTHGDGTVLLTMWLSTRYDTYRLWRDLQAMPDNSRAAIVSNFKLYLGKKLCSRGTVAQLEADYDHREPIWNGGIRVGDSGSVRFTTVGSVGDIHVGSTARFCGIVTGLRTFQNQLDGATTSPELVGTFDTSGLN